MSLAAPVAVTLVCMAWCLWIRRGTWMSRWEVAATLNIALQCAALLLMSPVASATLGHWLHTLTGMWNLEDYLGHACYIAAASAIAYNATTRLREGHPLQVHFHRNVELPATLGVALMLVFFTLGNGAAVYSPDFFLVPSDLWLAVYWVLAAALLIYLQIQAVRALTLLRDDPRSRLVANWSLVAVSFGIAACLLRIVTVVFPRSGDVFTTFWVWVLACLCGSILALAATYSWRRKLAWFTTPPQRFSPRPDIRSKWS
ncbi:hypothetical protein [uncultured Mycolicibacterium sp.]|uniref:hypothetical protein n=1 Tax=uncultured Mycolicibacterium sp. TaxID=2320817 RepID=UPI0026268A09|nr:hypothetical protein [uncultured Mycolicibacterium sp.]